MGQGRRFSTPSATFDDVVSLSSSSPPAAVRDGRIGGWRGDRDPAFAADDLVARIHAIREQAYVVVDPDSGRLGIASGGSLVDAHSPAAWPVTAVLPPMYPEWLGDRSFNDVHGTRFPYITGAMANGIATTRLVIEMARAGGLGFFGAAGLGRDVVSLAIDELVAELGDPAPRGVAT